jgi:hypothetical protein
MQHVPDAPRLLADIADLLEAEVMGSVPASVKHNVRVCAHLLRVVERELVLGPDAATAERQRLRALIDPTGTGATSPILEGAELIAAVRAGFAGADSQAWWDALRETAAADLAIAKPGYSDWVAE